MKRCFKCRRTLPLSEFYRHAMMADGHLNKCRVCTRRDVQEHRAKNAEYYREYDRERHNSERAAMISQSQRRHPDHHRARWTVHNAIRDRRLFKQPCEVCGAKKVEAHHDDYSQPLKVRWLCRKHHGMVHRIDEERRSA